MIEVATERKPKGDGDGDQTPAEVDKWPLSFEQLIGKFLLMLDKKEIMSVCVCVCKRER